MEVLGYPHLVCEYILCSGMPSVSPFHGRSFFCHHTKKEPKKKSPSANPHSARPVVPEKCLPRIQAIFPSLPVGTTGLPLHPPWRTVHTPCVFARLRRNQRATGKRRTKNRLFWKITTKRTAHPAATCETRFCGEGTGVSGGEETVRGFLPPDER